MLNSLVFAIRFPGKALLTIMQLGLIVFSYVFFTMLIVYWQNVPFLFEFICMLLLVFAPEAFLMTWGYRGMVVMDKYEEMVKQQESGTDDEE